MAKSKKFIVCDRCKHVDVIEKQLKASYRTHSKTKARGYDSLKWLEEKIASVHDELDLAKREKCTCSEIPMSAWEKILGAAPVK